MRPSAVEWIGRAGGLKYPITLKRDSDLLHAGDERERRHRACIETPGRRPCFRGGLKKTGNPHRHGIDRTFCHQSTRCSTMTPLSAVSARRLFAGRFRGRLIADCPSRDNGVPALLNTRSTQPTHHMTGSVVCREGFSNATPLRRRSPLDALSVHFRAESAPGHFLSTSAPSARPLHSARRGFFATQCGRARRIPCTFHDPQS